MPQVVVKCNRDRDFRLSPKRAGWYIAAYPHGGGYLHRDGKWYRSTHSPAGYTGYFKSEAEATATAVKYGHEVISLDK